MICQDIAVRNRKLIRYFVLAQQHTGDKYVDFDFPPDQAVLMNRQTWKNIENGDILEQTLANFDLPQYHHMDGYKPLIQLNSKRADDDLSGNFRP